MTCDGQTMKSIDCTRAWLRHPVYMRFRSRESGLLDQTAETTCQSHINERQQLLKSSVSSERALGQRDADRRAQCFKSRI